MHPPDTAIASIIVVNYNSYPAIVECLRSIQAQIQSVPYELIVVDNASSDDSVAQIKTQIPDCRVIQLTKNVGFGAGNNAGVQVASGEYLFFLNPDTVLLEDSLKILLQKIAKNPELGIVAPRIIYPDGRLQLSTAWEISLLGEYKTRKQLADYERGNHQVEIEAEYAHDRAVEIVLGSAFLMTKALFQMVGGFDEQFFMYFEESDLCQRVRARGYQILYTPDTTLVHLHGTSVQKIPDKMIVEYRRSQLYYYRKHHSWLEQFFLRSYLLAKFGLQSLKRGDRVAWQVIQLVLTH
ncbi:MAG TPA: glycosyltransferase family 2 protein [Leptolyngbyaceae cyanobacterium M33_DOE_097]|uniref:Glycosyltransferase family 2 protein n=1 Tax=Oscillatoriales cyanobacterium SpSt-418 TaxID=2282169 RepID=A0A7C3PEQ5_9CYAN|nr:glycosyltransferase family 2 protein [Leptolyngbyaceae cyanobacterium M33_DOE_097]